MSPKKTDNTPPRTTPAPKKDKVKKDTVLDDHSRLGGRVKRYARVSTTAAGLAAKMAGQKYLGLTVDKDTHARDLMLSLGDLKGPLLKVAQLLATIPNALPKEYAAELQKLQNQAPPMGWPFVRRRMMAELGAGWEKKFAQFEQAASAAASLGQVHRAQLHDGRRVACKLQYPDMASAVEADLKQLNLFLSLFEKYDKAVNTSEIRKEVADRLHEELDYGLEARHGKLYAHMLSAETAVHVPEVIDELSTTRLLTTTWLEGASTLDYLDAAQDVRNTIALNIFRAWYVPLYRYGVIHGDPHPGNYMVQKDLALNLLDFGCVRVFPARFIAGVITLYRALQANDTDMAVAAYESWGFKGLSRDVIDVLNVWARFLYGPVLEDKKRVIGELPPDRVYGEDTARKVHQALRENGGVTVPREFVFMDRAALGLGSVFLRLRAEVNWHTLFNEMIADFSQERLAATQQEHLPRFGITLPQ